MTTATPTPMNPATTHDSLLAICLYGAFSRYLPGYSVFWNVPYEISYL